MATRIDKWWPLAAGALVVIGLAPGATTRAQETPTLKRVPARPIVSIEGVDNYKEYCAVCHGVDAKGGGPAAPALKVPPPDLTRIAERRKGKFPTEDVMALISGNRTLPAHGSSDMPVWGSVFRTFGSGPDDQTHKLRILNLAKYLESLQVK
jgi:hypothetical protein